MNPKIWVVQEGNNDYSSAEEYGEVQFITKSDLRNTPGSEQTMNVYADIRKFKTQYIPGIDYIIPVGNPMIVVLVSMVLGFGNHKFLKWDGRRVTYVPFTLDSKKVN